MQFSAAPTVLTNFHFGKNKSECTVIQKVFTMLGMPLSERIHLDYIDSPS